MGERVRKINEQIAREVSETIERERKDSKTFITVTAVEAAPDLRHATVWCSVIGVDIDEATKILGSLRHPAQRDVNSKLTMKYVPRIELRLDHGGEYAQHIEEVMKQVRDEKEL